MPQGSNMCLNIIGKPQMVSIDLSLFVYYYYLSTLFFFFFFFFYHYYFHLYTSIHWFSALYSFSPFTNSINLHYFEWLIKHMRWISIIIITVPICTAIQLFSRVKGYWNTCMCWSSYYIVLPWFEPISFEKHWFKPWQHYYYITMLNILHYRWQYTLNSQRSSL